MDYKLAHASQSYTLPSRSKKPTRKPKLVKEYACPNAPKDSMEEGSTGYNNVYKKLRVLSEIVKFVQF